MIFKKNALTPYTAKLIYLNFNPLEIVYRYRDPQLQVGENYSYLFSFETYPLQILMFKHNFCSQYQ